jgi:hypothetical protein
VHGFLPARGSRGHYDVSQADIERMMTLLAAARFKPEATPDAVNWLYGRGYGYHAIADAFRISHERGYLLLTGQVAG